MQFLESSLDTSYPFTDAAVGTLVPVLADARLVVQSPGVYAITQFTFVVGSATATVSKDGSAFASVALTATTVGAYTFYRGVSPGCLLQCMAATRRIPLHVSVTAPLVLLDTVVDVSAGAVASIGGLSGDVVLAFSNYVEVSVEDGVCTLSAQDPYARAGYTGSGFVFSINGATADRRGRIQLSVDQCFRVTPSHLSAVKLDVIDVCEPCIKCSDLDLLLTHISTHENIYYALAGVHNDQFNRMQQAVLTLNRLSAEKLERAQAHFELNANDGGFIRAVSRVVQRAYFAQLIASITNSSGFDLEVSFTSDVGDLDGKVTIVEGSTRRTTTSDKHKVVNSWAGFSTAGAVTTTTVPAGTTVTLDTELHRTDPTAKFGVWSLPNTAVWVIPAGIPPAEAPDPLPFEICFGQQPIYFGKSAPTSPLPSTQDTSYADRLESTYVAQAAARSDAEAERLIRASEDGSLLLEAETQLGDIQTEREAVLTAQSAHLAAVYAAVDALAAADDAYFTQVSPAIDQAERLLGLEAMAFAAFTALGQGDELPFRVEYGLTVFTRQLEYLQAVLTEFDEYVDEPVNGSVSTRAAVQSLIATIASDKASVQAATPESAQYALLEASAAARHADVLALSPALAEVRELARTSNSLKTVVGVINTLNTTFTAVTGSYPSTEQTALVSTRNTARLNASALISGSDLVSMNAALAEAKIALTIDPYAPVIATLDARVALHSVTTQLRFLEHSLAKQVVQDNTPRVATALSDVTDAIADAVDALTDTDINDVQDATTSAGAELATARAVMITSQERVAARRSLADVIAQMSTLAGEFSSLPAAALAASAELSTAQANLAVAIVTAQGSLTETSVASINAATVAAATERGTAEAALTTNAGWAILLGEVYTIAAELMSALALLDSWILAAPSTDLSVVRAAVTAAQATVAAAQPSKNTATMHSAILEARAALAQVPSVTPEDPECA